MEFLPILFSLSAVIQLTLAFVIFLGSKEYSSRTFSLLTLLGALWVSSEGFFHAMPEHLLKWATFFNTTSFIIGIMIASTWLYFTLTFPENIKPKTSVTLTLILINILLIPVYIYPNLFLGPAVWVGGIGHWGWQNGPYLFLYDIVFVTLWFIGFVTIYLKSKKYTGETQKHLRFMILTGLIGIIPIEIAALLLPRFLEHFDVTWVSSLATTAWPLFMGYSIVKHNQMNVKTVLTELLVIACIMLLFLSIFI